MNFKKRIAGAALAVALATTTSPSALMAWDAADDAEKMLSVIEARAHNVIDITYEDASEQAGAIVISGVSIVLPDGKQVASAASATLGKPTSGDAPSFIELSGLTAAGDDDDETVSIETLRVSGASAIDFVLSNDDIDNPFAVIDALEGDGEIAISGLTASGGRETVSLNSLAIEVDGENRILERFALSGLSVDEGGVKGDKVKIDNISFGGVRFGAAADLAALEGSDDEAAINAAIDRVTEEMNDLMGVESLNINGVNVQTRKGETVTVDEITLGDLQYHNGMVVGGKIKVANAGVHNSKDAQEFGMQGFVVDMTGSSGIAADGKSVDGATQIVLRDGAELVIKQSATIDSADSWVERRKEMVREQLGAVLRHEFLGEGEGKEFNPLGELFAHDDVSVEMKLTDLGLIAAAIEKTSAETGFDAVIIEGQARLMLPVYLRKHLPEDELAGLLDEISGFLKDSSPFHVALATVDGWQDKVAGIADSGEVDNVIASDIVSLSFPQDGNAH